MVGYAGSLVFCVAVAALGFISWLKRRSDGSPVSALRNRLAINPNRNRLELPLLSYKHWRLVLTFAYKHALALRPRQWR
jgi:hypothetical protein